MELSQQLNVFFFWGGGGGGVLPPPRISSHICFTFWGQLGPLYISSTSNLLELSQQLNLTWLPV